jgi:hypothetical protein
MKHSLRALAFVACVMAMPGSAPVHASQGSCILPTTGTVSGLTLVNDINACNGSLLSLYSGASAPAGPTTGMLWYNTTSGNVEQYDVSTWQLLWFVDATNHLSTPDIGGGIVSASIASSSTTDLGSVPQSFKTVTGTVAITSFGSSAGVGTVHVVKFSGSLTLTYNGTSMILPSGFNITTQTGDVALALYLGGGNWQVINYTPATGFAVASSFPLGTVLMGDYAIVPPKFVYGAGQALSRASFPAYLDAVARAQSGTLTASNATITGIANTAGFGAGMPVEATGINAGCTIASFVANTSITLNSSGCVTGTGSVTVTVFLTGYGSGGSGSTVGVRDCRGRVMAGRDDLGGAAAGRLTVAVFGSGATVNNGSGGSQSYTLLRSDLPNVQPTFTGTAANSNQSNVLQGGTLIGGFQSTSGSSDAFSVAPSASSISTTAAGTVQSLNGNVTQTSFGISQPTGIADCIVAVLP